MNSYLATPLITDEQTTHRKFFNNLHPLGAGEARKTSFGMSLEFDLELRIFAFPLRSSLGLQDYESHGTFAPLRMRTGDDRYLKYVSVRSEFCMGPRQVTKVSMEQNDNIPCSIARLDAF